MLLNIMCYEITAIILKKLFRNEDIYNLYIFLNILQVVVTLCATTVQKKCTPEHKIIGKYQLTQNSKMATSQPFFLSDLL